MQDVALVVPLMTKLTPDLSELGSVFFYCTHCLANHVDPPMQGADGPMLFFHLCVSVSSVSELLTDCEFQHLVHCSVSSFFSLYLPLNQHFQVVQYQELCFHLNIGG